MPLSYDPQNIFKSPYKQGLSTKFYFLFTNGYCSLKKPLMTQKKFTQGEWSFIKDTQTGLESSYNILVDADGGWGKWVATAQFPKLYGGTTEEAKANALLIAHAPQLLEMLERISEMVIEDAPHIREEILELIKSATEL